MVSLVADSITPVMGMISPNAHVAGLPSLPTHLHSKKSSVIVPSSEIITLASGQRRVQSVCHGRLHTQQSQYTIELESKNDVFQSSYSTTTGYSSGYSITTGYSFGDSTTTGYS